MGEGKLSLHVAFGPTSLAILCQERLPFRHSGTAVEIQLANGTNPTTRI